MAGTSRDMTADRPGGASPVYGLYGVVDDTAATLADLLRGRATLRQIPTGILAALETGSPRLRAQALNRITQHEALTLAGAAGFDDWWNGALDALNTTFPLVEARRLVTDKAALYQRLRAHGVAVPGFITGTLSTRLVADALSQFGPDPVLKPTTGAGSRGVYRYRDDLPAEDNLALYRQLLRLGHIDSTTPILALQYIGGPDALEISVDIIITDGEIIDSTVHEKLTATDVHPFVDRVMVSPPIHPAITAALPLLDWTIGKIATVLAIADGVLHVELRLHHGSWHVLDVGVRPGAGLVAHSVQALTGLDPRLAHLLASAGRPLTDNAIKQATPTHPATCIACCYIAEVSRPAATLADQAALVAELRRTPDLIGWHLNAAETADEVYLPDAGLSIGVGAPDPRTAINRLRSIVEPYHYTTT
jgi:hypothetical protein